jgi:hypothetical protein
LATLAEDLVVVEDLLRQTDRVLLASAAVLVDFLTGHCQMMATLEQTA